MQRWIGARILVALGMLTSLVFGIVGVLREDRTPPRWSLEVPLHRPRAAIRG
jgi:hypothetical protein